MFRIFSESVFQKIYIYHQYNQYNQYTMTIPRFDYVFSKTGFKKNKTLLPMNQLLTQWFPQGFQ